MKLEDLTPDAAVRGILPDSLVTVVSVKWFGSEALELTFKTPDGGVDNRLLYRHDEADLQVVERGRPWGFDGATVLCFAWCPSTADSAGAPVRSSPCRPHVGC